jgi:hypothetical protein
MEREAKMQNLAVFTGDIVRSSDLDSHDLSQVFDALGAAADAIGGWPDGMSVFARFRGDGWQMALPQRFALRGSLVIQAATRSTGKGRSTRIGVGIGEGMLSGGDLAGAQGPAFVRSGHALDTMKRTVLLAAPDAPRILRAALPLADRIAQGWTPKQSIIIQHLLAPAPPTQEALGARLGHSRQLMQKQAEAAGLSALLESCDVYESAQEQPN